MILVWISLGVVMVVVLLWLRSAIRFVRAVERIIKEVGLSDAQREVGMRLVTYTRKSLGRRLKLHEMQQVYAGCSGIPEYMAQMIEDGRAPMQDALEYVDRRITEIDRELVADEIRLFSG